MQVLIQLEVQGMFNRVVRLVGGHGLRDIVWRLGGNRCWGCCGGLGVNLSVFVDLGEALLREHYSF